MLYFPVYFYVSISFPPPLASLQYRYSSIGSLALFVLTSIPSLSIGLACSYSTTCSSGRSLLLISLMMAAVSTSEISVNFYETTWCNISEGCHLHTHCCKNLKSHSAG
jgi:hypothetical protein